MSVTEVGVVEALLSATVKSSGEPSAASASLILYTRGRSSSPRVPSSKMVPTPVAGVEPGVLARCSLSAVVTAWRARVSGPSKTGAAVSSVVGTLTTKLVTPAGTEMVAALLEKVCCSVFSEPSLSWKVMVTFWMLMSSERLA